jgi:chromate transporter
MPPRDDDAGAGRPRGIAEVFLVFLRLGVSSFGGPVAHLGYFHAEFVTRRRWLSEHNYADIVALCQFLPGPASSQVGMVLGLSRAGIPGALAAWAGFTLPSALMLVLFALSLSASGAIPAGALHGLKIVAVAVVAQAVWGMARKLCNGWTRLAIMALSAGVVLLFQSAWGQAGVIAGAGLVGMLLFRPGPGLAYAALPMPLTRRAGALLLGLFFILLFGLPVLAGAWPQHTLAVASAFYQAGALVFGGGHVVLPLLQAAVVPAHWVANDTFLAGYGMTQAVPGPLFTFAAFLGASMQPASNGWAGAALCLLAIFAPSFLLVLGVLPFWEQLRHSRRTQAALAGVNAAVVGLLLAAMYRPVWTSAIFSLADFGLALCALLALVYWKLPPWLVVLGCGGAGWLLGLVS